MNFEGFSQILKLFEDSNSNLLSNLLGGLFQSENEKANPEQQNLDPNDQIWQLPHFDFVENSKQNFVNQKAFEQTKQNFEKPQENAPSFDFEKILNLLNTLKTFFQKQEQKQESKKPSFVESLKRCN